MNLEFLKGKRDTTEAKRSYALSLELFKRGKAAKAQVLRDKDKAIVAVSKLNATTQKRDRLNVEYKMWSSKALVLSKLQPKAPSNAQTKALLKDDQKKLKALDPLVVAFNEIEGKAKTCHRLAIQKNLFHRMQ